MDAPNHMANLMKQMLELATKMKDIGWIRECVELCAKLGMNVNKDDIDHDLNKYKARCEYATQGSNKGEAIKMKLTRRTIPIRYLKTPYMIIDATIFHTPIHLLNTNTIISTIFHTPIYLLNMNIFILTTLHIKTISNLKTNFPL